MVYEALGRLAARDAVMTLPSGDTVKYAPLPVDVLLDKLRHSYEEALDCAHETLSKEERAIHIEQVWNIDGKDAVLARAREMIRGSRFEIIIAAGDESLFELIHELRAANNRGVRTRFLISGEVDVDFGEVFRHSNAESALQDTRGSLVLVVDASQCLIGGTGSHETCIWTGNRHVVFVARQYLWQEVFTQKVLARLGQEVYSLLTPEERRAILGETD